MSSVSLSPQQREFIELAYMKLKLAGEDETALMIRRYALDWKYRDEDIRGPYNDVKWVEHELTMKGLTA